MLAIAYLSLSLVFISYMLIIIMLIYYMFDIACASLIYMLEIDCVLTLTFNQERYHFSSTLNLEES